MLINVACRKCKKELKVQSIIRKDSNYLIVVEPCSEPGCTEQTNPDFAKYLRDMLQPEYTEELL